MAGIEVSSAMSTCFRCGKAYGRKKGNFPVSYAPLYKGVGYIPYCRECIDTLYNTYLAQCKDAKAAVRQVCRKLDLYWNDGVFTVVERKNTTHTMMTAYMAKVVTNSYAGKSYDDTLAESGTLWEFAPALEPEQKPEEKEEVKEEPVAPVEDTRVVEQDVIDFWGPGLTVSQYIDLEQRKVHWLNELKKNGYGANIDIGAMSLIRQICNLELTINRDMAAEKPIKDSVNALNTLLGSLNVKPAQKKEDSDSSADNTPFGVWIRRFENDKPIPEPDPELRDVDGIVKYILTWVYGHLAKMLNIKNAHTRLYEDEIAKYRVERPEYDGEDDDSMLYDIFSGDSDYEESGGAGIE